MQMDSLQYANGRMKEYEFFSLLAFFFPAFYEQISMYKNITNKKSRQINIAMLFAGTLSLYNEL